MFRTDSLAALTSQVRELSYQGCDGVVEVTLVGAPDGDITYHVVLQVGCGPRYEAGPAVPAADASFDQGWSDAVAQIENRFDPVVAFMQGSLKVKGATRPLYDLFYLWADPRHRAAWSALLAP